MSRVAIWITLAVVLFVASLGASAYVWHRAQTALIVVDTREMLGHPAQTPEQRMRSLQTLELMERDTGGPLQRYRAVPSAHTLEAYGSIGGWSVRGTVQPFVGELAAFEAELWTRLARDLDAERVRELVADGFALDAFPFGRAQYEFSMSSFGTNDRSTFEMVGPAGKRTVTGVLGFDAALAAVVAK